MNTPFSDQSTAPEGTDKLTETWLRAAHAPNDPQCANELAKACHDALATLLPDGSCWGQFAGQERAIRQNALIMLHKRMLKGNGALRDATAAGALESISRHLRTAIGVSLRYALLRLVRSETNRVKRQEEFHEETFFGNDHASLRRSLFELPAEMRLELASAAIAIARRDNLLSPEAAETVSLMLQKGWSAADAAKALGKSRQAVYVSVRQARKHLPALLDEKEFPML